MRLLLSLVLLLAAPFAAAGQVTWYLHGKFVEEYGPQGVHPQHGPYEYRDILVQLGREGAHVRSEVRAKDTDIAAYADRIAAEVRAELAAGTPAAQLAVVGASKGALIASEVAVRLANPDVTFVLMGACDWPQRLPALKGRVFAIHEATDEFSQNCPVYDETREGLVYQDLQLHTGRGHGFLYTAAAWIEPALDWIARR
jgi:hypothetical protein